jgi:hypothetical protein
VSSPAAPRIPGRKNGGAIVITERKGRIWRKSYRDHGKASGRGGGPPGAARPSQLQCFNVERAPDAARELTANTEKSSAPVDVRDGLAPRHESDCLYITINPAKGLAGKAIDNRMSGSKRLING